MPLHARSVVTCLALATFGFGCLGPTSEATDDSEIRAAGEFDVAVLGHRIDAPEMVGTFDAAPGQTPGAEFSRLILLNDGTALACPAGSACRPVDAASVRRPYEILDVPVLRERYLLLRTSKTDPQPFRVYAVESAGGAEWTFREVKPTGTGLRWMARRLPCSETMYQEDGNADQACGFYRCKLDTARSAEERCSYYSDFGMPYCKKYVSVDFKNREFGPRVRQCLQEVIRDTMESMSCVDVEKAAVRSHVDCYVASGFCDLSLSDKLRIARQIEPKDLSLEFGRTFKRIEKACLTNPAEDD